MTQPAPHPPADPQPHPDHAIFTDQWFRSVVGSVPVPPGATQAELARIRISTRVMITAQQPHDVTEAMLAGLFVASHNAALDCFAQANAAGLQPMQRSRLASNAFAAMRAAMALNRKLEARRTAAPRPLMPGLADLGASMPQPDTARRSDPMPSEQPNDRAASPPAATATPPAEPATQPAQVPDWAAIVAQRFNPMPSEPAARQADPVPGGPATPPPSARPAPPHRTAPVNTRRMGAAFRRSQRAAAAAQSAATPAQPPVKVQPHAQ